ncbi:MAG TPA: hypothetical protein VL486_13180 [Verrucomicrobiae bacterium]|nr:hypothetical protein [Verrucomicrobiae bacterium]
MPVLLWTNPKNGQAACLSYVEAAAGIRRYHVCSAEAVTAPPSLAIIPSAQHFRCVRLLQ